MAAQYQCGPGGSSASRPGPATQEEEGTGAATLEGAEIREMESTIGVLEVQELLRGYTRK